MIVLISFEEDLIITREEAIKLNLQFEEVKNVGIKNNKLTAMSSYDYYRDQLIVKNEEY